MISMVEVINIYLLKKFVFNKILNDFILYKKINKIKKNKNIIKKYIGLKNKNSIVFYYDFLIIYNKYKKSNFLFKLNERNYI
jgi:hypothetical protein